MLERVLEPEVMETEEDAREYEAIDNSTVNAEFVNQALRIASSRGEAIDIGAGPGHVAVLLARRAPGWRVLAVRPGRVDAQAGARARRRERHGRAGHGALRRRERDRPRLGLFRSRSIEWPRPPHPGTGRVLRRSRADRAGERRES